MGWSIEETVRFAREELKELAECGCDVWDLERRLALIEDEKGPDQAKRLEALCRSLEQAEPQADFAYQEPSDLAEIRARRPAGPRRIAVPTSDAVLDDRTLGAWLGRGAGCMLGKPVEGWSREKIEDLMSLCGLKALDDYWPAPPAGASVAFHAGAEGLPARQHPHGRPRRRHGLHRRRPLHPGEARPRLHPAQRGGLLARTPALSHAPTRPSASPTATWSTGWGRRSAPSTATPTASGSARRSGRTASATPRPAGPSWRPSMAFRDACISHVKNGIYGEMLVAAMLAAAFVTGDAGEGHPRSGWPRYPQNCRLAEAIARGARLARGGLRLGAALDRIMEAYGHYHRVHTINNARRRGAGRCSGARATSRAAVGIAVMGGLDTDCNGATAGSVLGAMLGARAIPSHWTEPLHDRIATIVAYQWDLTLSGLTARTRAVQKGGA